MWWDLTFLAGAVLMPTARPLGLALSSAIVWCGLEGHAHGSQLHALGTNIQIQVIASGLQDNPSTDLCPFPPAPSPPRHSLAKFWTGCRNLDFLRVLLYCGLLRDEALSSFM